jgi:hypothetical protein
MGVRRAEQANITDRLDAARQEAIRKALSG